MENPASHLAVDHFKHIQSAHCESGVVSSLFTNKGFPLSEPMVFGIGSGLFFAHFPFIKVMGIPVTTFRSRPGTIFHLCCKRLKVKTFAKRFSNERQGATALDEFLAQNIPVGIQANIYWLTYFSDQFRFQFNGHNLIVKEILDNDYVVSDPVIDTLKTCPRDDLTRARFAKGAFAPRGLIYFPMTIPDRKDVSAAALAGLNSTLFFMLSPTFLVGVNGIRYLSHRIQKWTKGDLRRARLWLAQVVRMQEEIGTGGAGFRFMFAAFLQETAELTGKDFLYRGSEMMTSVGDLWRGFAAESARVCKTATDASAFKRPSELLLECAAAEENALRYLKKHMRG